ncbi:MAG: M14 family metallopeptidase [Patescibacteria group bacterium]
MRPFLKKILFGVVVLCVVALGVFFVLRKDTEIPVPVDTTVPEFTSVVIGTSVQGRSIEAISYGTGDTHLLFVGGIHGGYEWNSVLLAYEMMDYLELHPELIPENLTVTIVPSANPDGVFKVVGKEGRFARADVPDGDDSPGRFNANNVDLNRNFDCKWKPESMWRGDVVSAGTSAFSEPEARALRDFVLANDPAIVVFWHSQSNAVYASECKGGILPETRTLMNLYASSAGYSAVDTFDSYEITGDAEGWLASINIPAITVELSTHETTEWEKNLAGMKALLTQYAR